MPWGANPIGPSPREPPRAEAAIPSKPSWRDKVTPADDADGDAVPVPKSDPRSLADVKPGQELRITVPAGKAAAGAPRAETLPGLIPELAPIVQRESGGKPFVGYTPPGQPLVDLSNAPLDETGFPIWDGNIDPSTGKRSHAAGIAQIQPDTWRPIAKQLGIKDFSLESQVKAANELHRQEGDKPWAASAGGYGKDRVTSAGKWNVADDAIRHEQGRSNTSVVWMSPDDYLGMIPDEAENPKPKRQSLMKSLDAGDKIEAIPTLDAKVDKGRLKIFDQDGRNRAEVAKQEGVDLIPVAVHGVGGEAPQWVEDMRGNVRRFNFDPVPKMAPPPRPWWERGFREAGRAAGEAVADTAGVFGGLALGATRPMIGAAQLAGKGGAALGIPGAEGLARGADTASDLVETAINRLPSAPNLPGDPLAAIAPNPRNAAMVGDVAATAAVPVSRIGELGTAGRIVAPAATRAGAGAGPPGPPGGNYWQEKALQVGAGAALGV